LEPIGYEALVHYFRSSAWTLEIVKIQWIRVVKNSESLFTENEMPILIGDGVKQSKEGRKMPGVKRLHQESENSGKAEYIFGHMFGAVGILVGNIDKLFCLPLSASLQDGDKVMRKWHDETYESVSHVVQILRDASSIAVVCWKLHFTLGCVLFHNIVPARDDKAGTANGQRTFDSDQGKDVNSRVYSADRI
jgi:hypothetical protein